MKRAARWTDLVSSALEAAGIGVVSYGLGSFCAPVGWVFLGVMTFLVGVAFSPKAEKGHERRPEHR